MVIGQRGPHFIATQQAEIERLRAALRKIIQRGTSLSQGDPMPVYTDAIEIAAEALRE